MSRFDRYTSVITSATRTLGSLRGTRPNIKGLTPTSTRARAIAAGGALAVVTGVAAPVALSQSSHDAPSTSVVTAQQVVAGKVPTSAKAPSGSQLHPVGIQGSQSDLSLSADQVKNAQKIVAAGKSMGLPPRAWVIALATSMQETKLHNYGDLGGANDHDSLGLFQQRPSSGWGTPQELTDPTYAAKAFYTSLTQVHGWSKMPLTDAAQAVQVSAFGDRYAQWEAKAGDVVDSFYGQGPMAHGHTNS